MAVAAVSALTDTPVDGTMAVTGEITVQGKVKAVGGVPQKVEAACQAGLLRVLIPKENDAETLHIACIEVQGIDDVHQALSAMLVSTKTAKKLIPSPLPMTEKVAAAAAEPSAWRRTTKNLHSRRKKSLHHMFFRLSNRGGICILYLCRTGSAVRAWTRHDTLWFAASDEEELCPERKPI